MAHPGHSTCEQAISSLHYPHAEAHTVDSVRPLTLEDREMCNELHNRICYIIPPHIHETIARNGSDRQKEQAYQALNVSAHMRGQREILNTFAVLASTPTGVKRRTIYNAQNGLALPGKLVRGEGDPKSKDTSVNEAYDGSGKTYDFYLKAYARNSIDDRGLRLDSSVHYRRNFNNA